jgi:hypothetical protein
VVKVYIEARPKGRPEGSPIEDYVVEEQGDRVLKTFKTQQRRSPGQRVGSLAPRGARPAFERQENSGSLARGLGRLRGQDNPANKLPFEGISLILCGIGLCGCMQSGPSPEALANLNQARGVRRPKAEAEAIPFRPSFVRTLPSRSSGAQETRKCDSTIPVIRSAEERPISFFHAGARRSQV